MNNITTFNFSLGREERSKLSNHTSFVVWFTGLSGSGKSTLANMVEKLLYEQKVRTFVLDGDSLRNGLNKELDFSPEEREENLRVAAEVAKILVSSGSVVLASFISPKQANRDLVKEIIGEQDFIETFVNTSLETCEKRDVKGLYKKARAGEIKNFTGIDSPYEKPKNPEIEINTEKENLQEAANRIVNLLQKKLELK
ncbi:adenylyl-sulfate kinase [Salegentibacter salegens]|uniref:Adenylyl-sulfate kinase n=1 Tax=Salegentibacter salegens TaxID=143223 RepID=A0A1M7HBA1_9FLAO|nr:adenylyl-sulfate kinase [Salegentibacter salegens]PRX43525.1 adenylylsulfate kinase [Salegentibacter salegens]SHM25729.1 adenylylsulfate kinase [Salegentibacter salegens]